MVKVTRQMLAVLWCEPEVQQLNNSNTSDLWIVTKCVAVCK